MPVAVVTDSTAYLPQSLVDQWGVRVAPVVVTIAGRSYEEGVEITPQQVAEALKEWQPVSTSRPTPTEFTSLYQAARDAGADAVVSIHLSAELSGTYESAVLAARTSDFPVEVLDSRSIGMGLGFAVLAAAQAAGAGQELSEVVGAAQRVIDGARVLFYVDTLEYLRRGGRIGAASAMFGTALRVKPLLQVLDGKVQPLEKARTSGKAIARLVDLAVERAAGAPVHVAVQHLDSPVRAQEVADALRVRLDVEQVIIGEVGAVVGTHVGPGMVSVSLAPRT